MQQSLLLFEVAKAKTLAVETSVCALAPEQKQAKTAHAQKREATESGE